MLQGGQPINDRLSRPKNSITCVNKPAPRPPTLYQKTMPNMASSCTSIKKRCLERQRPPTPYLVPKRPALSHTGQVISKHLYTRKEFLGHYLPSWVPILRKGLPQIFWV